MTANVFVDTNVLVYACSDAEPRRQAVALDWLQRLWNEERGRTSFQVLSEYFRVVTRKLKPPMVPDRAWADVERYFAWQPQETNRELLLAAREIEKRYRLSWWDSMIVAAARLQDCSLLLTEDLQHGLVIGALTVHNPFLAAVGEASAPYQVPRVPPRHRPRGRPPGSNRRRRVAAV
jgi:predicted nucleic acid-binding protein